MNRKAISLSSLAFAVTGSLLLLAGCFHVPGDLDFVAAPAPLFITFVNNSDDPAPTVFVFAVNAVPGFDELADGVAWRVLPNLGKGSSSSFMVLPMCTVRAVWGGANATQSLVAEAGVRYAVIEDDTGIVLVNDGSATQPNAIEVVSHVQIAGGLDIQLMNDSKVMLQERVTAYGQKATFVLEPQLYWGIASDIQEGQILGSAVSDTADFFEQNLDSVFDASVTLTGDAQSGYQFEVTND